MTHKYKAHGNNYAIFVNTQDQLFDKLKRSVLF